jgi:hypothetical protein
MNGGCEAAGAAAKLASEVKAMMHVQVSLTTAPGSWGGRRDGDLAGTENHRLRPPMPPAPTQESALTQEYCRGWRLGRIPHLASRRVARPQGRRRGVDRAQGFGACSGGAAARCVSGW